MKTRRMNKSAEGSKAVSAIRRVICAGFLVMLNGCAVEDMENFSAAMSAVNSGLGYEESSYSYDSPSSSDGGQLGDSGYADQDHGSEESTSSEVQVESVASVRSDEVEAVASEVLENKAPSRQIHVYAIAYGKNDCGQETALGYAYSVVDAESEVQEKRRLEAVLQDRYHAVSRCRSSSSKFDYGADAKAAMLISWQGGTQKCPTTVFSYVYGGSTQEATSKASAHFKRWAPGGAAMQTVDLRRFTD